MNARVRVGEDFLTVMCFTVTASSDCHGFQKVLYMPVRTVAVCEVRPSLNIADI